MQTRLKRFYRTEAPPLPEPPDPPLPTWRERYREPLSALAVVITAIVMVGMFANYMNAADSERSARLKAKRVDEFRAATKGCILAERTHGEQAEVVYQCGERRERFPASWEAEARAKEVWTRMTSTRR